MPQYIRINQTQVSKDDNKKHEWAKLERLSTQPKEDLTKLREITLYNNPHVFKRKQEYDHFFAYTKTFPLFDGRKIRDNRGYPPDIHENIFQQEKNKAVPVLSSLEYGRPCRPILDKTDNKHNRQGEIASMYRRHDVMPPIEREPM